MIVEYDRTSTLRSNSNSKLSTMIGTKKGLKEFLG